METNAYTSAMERLALTPAMRARVLDGALAQIEIQPVHQKRQTGRILPLALAACLLLLVAAIAIPRFLPQTREPNVLIVSPVHESESVAQLKADAPFPLLAPGALPEGYTVESAAMIAGTLAQIKYAGPEGAITYRMARGADDVSGDYNWYADTATEQIGAYSVTLKGDSGKVSLCVWTDDAHSYALAFTQPAVPETARAVIESMESVK